MYNFHNRTCIIEGTIIGLSLALVPVLLLAVLIFFPDDVVSNKTNSDNFNNSTLFVSDG